MAAAATGGGSRGALSQVLAQKTISRSGHCRIEPGRRKSWFERLRARRLISSPRTFPRASASRSKPAMAREKFYAIARGRVPGVYRSWDEASRQVTSYSGAVHKSFGTHAEAARWVEEQRGTSATNPRARTRTRHGDPAARRARRPPATRSRRPNARPPTRPPTPTPTPTMPRARDAARRGGRSRGA